MFTLTGVSADRLRLNVCEVGVVDITWPEAVVAHGVDGGDVVWADVAVVDGGVCFRGPIGIVPVWVRSDLSQEAELQRTALIVPPEEPTVLQ